VFAKKSLLIMTAILALSVAVCTSGTSVVPTPKEITISGAPIALESVAIVVGGKASEPEKYAAETLQRTIKKRFGQVWPVRRENENLSAYKTVILLGQRGTNGMLDRLCREWRANLNEKSPGHDGYIIRMGKSQGRQVVMVGGSNPRGVVYGQDTLFQLISRRNGKLLLARASVRDWPSIPWRGRPPTFVGNYTRPGLLDVFAQARINFVDIRDADSVYGTPAGRKLDKSLIANAIHEAHRRGFVVYGTVNCAVRANEYDATIRTFQEMIDLGVDGLWISVDDPGGVDRVGTPYELIRRVVELGRKHGITGSRIAIVPGKESYKAIDTQVNRTTARIPGMENALYFFTLLPSAQALHDTRAVGIKSKPCWWHNWPRPRGGFTNVDNATYRLDGKPSYTEPMPLSEGWHNPTWQVLADAGRYTDAVMPWGGSGWGTEMVAPVIGWWAWSPESAAADWKAARTRLYDTIYGPSLVDAAFAFDDRLAEVKKLFIMSPDGAGQSSEQSSWPPVLRNQSDRPKVKKLLADMEAPLKRLEAGAPKETMLEQGYLREYYLEPARGQLDAAKLMVDLDYPEYWWTMHEARMLMAAKSGDFGQAKTWNDEAKSRVERETKRVLDVLSPTLKGIDEYVRSWQERFRPPATVRKVSAPPVMNGDLSDPIWQQAEKEISFGPAGDQTEVRLLYTDDALYVGFVCHETMPEMQVVKRTARDSEVWEDDSVEVFINTDGLGYPYYQLISNMAGVMFDARRLPGAGLDISWNADWEVRTKNSGGEWTAEFKISFQSLGLDSAPSGRMWLCNFAREDHAAKIRLEYGDKWWDVTAWGRGSGVLHDPAKFRPVVFAD